ncbi:D-alanyl-D-alanine carboxypeptidase family protein [Paenibacillus sp. GCM10023252]|uniref:D-alanyl-D-alanine carboxypeptidase family protein n=1 Tax=Paenibacillus sp. GCM10023252 TaxID=3252649 RepID=UPI00360A9E4D
MRTGKSNARRWRSLLLLVAFVGLIIAYMTLENRDNAAQSPALTAGGDTSTASPSPSDEAAVSPSPSEDGAATPVPTPSDKPEETAKPTVKPTVKPTAKPTSKPASGGAGSGGSGAIAVVAQPESITALVNKQNGLPREYEPTDLVFPDVPFLFKEKIDKRKLRKEAAAALEEMFAGAKDDGVALAGVSAYRSYATQKALFERYVKKDGEAKARTYSAYPGTSEHETGLAIDVSGSTGKCAATSCFGGSKEAVWLDKHAAEYGFIIRYPKGKQSITGYMYEPWHLRFVGKELAKELTDKEQTLEEYYNAVPVTK